MEWRALLYCFAFGENRMSCHGLIHRFDESARRVLSMANELTIAFLHQRKEQRWWSVDTPSSIANAVGCSP